MKSSYFSLILISLLVFGIVGASAALATGGGSTPNYCRYADLDKTDHYRTVCLGAEFTYDITFNFNESAADANVTVVRLRDVLPPEVDFVSATDGGVYNATKHKVFWKFENPEFPQTVSVTVREASGEIGTEHKNKAIARFVIDPNDQGSITRIGKLTCDWTKVVDCEEIPEFPTVALPIAAILGIAFILQRRKEE